MDEGLKELVDEYCSSFGKSTKRAYKRVLLDFFEFASDLDISNPNQIYVEAQRYVEDREGEGLKSNTINLGISVIKGYFKWLSFQKNLFEYNPLERLKQVPVNDLEKTKVPTKKEVVNILQSLSLENKRDLETWIALNMLIAVDDVSSNVLSLRPFDINENLPASSEEIKNLRDSVNLYIDKKREVFGEHIEPTDRIYPKDRSSIYRHIKTIQQSLGMSGIYNLESFRLFGKESRLPYRKVQSLYYPEKDDSIFLSDDEFLTFVEEAFRKKNVILQGPPGTGKSFVAKKLADVITNNHDECFYQVQMHPSFHYEDFVQGYRPGKNGNVELIDGLFLEVCKNAIQNPDFNYVLLIEEINRCDLNQVFGELLHLLEATKRTKECGVRLMYQHNDESFYVPPNLHVVATMNTADRSTVNIDYAMKRRFSFLNVQPQFSSSKFERYMVKNGFVKNDVLKIKSKMTKINDEITKTRHLGEGFMIGHSYFCDNKKNLTIDKWLTKKMNFEIKPILMDYWYEDQALVEELIRL